MIKVMILSLVVLSLCIMITVHSDIQLNDLEILISVISSVLLGFYINDGEKVD